MSRLANQAVVRLALAGLALLVLSAAEAAVFDQVLGWQCILFSAPIVILLASGAAWWIAGVNFRSSGEAN